MNAGTVTSPARGRAARAPGLRWLRKAIAITAMLATCENAMAFNLLRRNYAGSVSPPSADAVAAAAAAAQAAAAARQANSPLRRALDAIRQYQAAQDAARAAAEAAPSDVPNGLGIGGLDVAPGATPGSLLWQGANLPTQTSDNGRTAVTVTQNQEKAILTWNTFNVGRETDLHFDQSAGGDSANSWIALNRVVDPSAAPSRILGSIKAEGQVYIINRNGIIFGGTSQVNVATLIASGLEIYGGDQSFKNGLLSTPGVTFGGDALAVGSVTVEAGAKIAVGSYGQALLLGGQVVNAGSIEAPDGQVLLAAGTGVSLARASDNRGYAPPIVTAGGSVENAGIISTPRGNITVAGNAFAQNALLTATTSGEANGSITIGQNGLPIQNITFGEGSATQILPDEGGKKVVGTSQFKPSEIDVYGEKITFLDNSTFYAPSGNVTLSAQMSTADTQAGVPDDSRLYVGAGARIDVSGLQDVVVPMEQNTIEAQLRANELRDNPLLRDNPAIRGRTIYFDARLGVSVADVSGYYDLIERDVEQLMTRGGSVHLDGNAIVTREGSVIDLSGGSLRYLDGYVRSTQLITETGRRVRIEDAQPGVRYVGIDGDFVVSHSRWGVTETYSSELTRSHPRFERGYEEGASAGTLQVGIPIPINNQSVPSPDPEPTGAFRIFDGQVVANVVVGPNQRELPSGSTDPTRVWREQPSGATLQIYRAGDVTIADLGPQLGADFRADSALDAAKIYQHVLPAGWFDEKTFTNVNIQSGETDNATSNTAGTTNYAPGGHLTIGAGVVVDLGDGGSFAFSGKQAEIDGTLRAPGGKVRIETRDLPCSGALCIATDAPERPTTHLGSTGVIDVAGRLTNDHLGGSGPLRALDGGSITLMGGDVILEQGSLIDVSGGARVDATGTKLVAGKGGSITIDVNEPPNPQPSQGGPFDGRLVLDGTLSGYAAGAGGALTIITAADIFIGNALPWTASAETSRLFTPEFFTQGGFSTFTLVGERGVTVTSGTALASTVIAPSVETLVVPDRVAELPSGTRLVDWAPRQVLPEGQRLGMTLNLSTIPARGGAATSTDVIVERGAQILMDPGSSLNLSSSGTLFVDGTIQAPGGNIQLTTGSGTGPGSSSIRLGPNAQLLAPGYEKSTPDGGSVQGAQVRRSVAAGGTITISSPNVVLVDPGAILDVSGIRGVADLEAVSEGPTDRARYEAHVVDGSAGAISITAGSGVVSGTFKLAPGGETGAGGSLTFNSSTLPIVVRQGVPAGFGVTSTAQTGQAVPTNLTVVADTIDASGADSLVLNALPQQNLGVDNAILFDGDVSLETRRSLTLLSPMIGTTDPTRHTAVTLTSGYVQLRGGRAADPSVYLGGAPVSDLTVSADLIDLANPVWLGCRTPGCTSGGFATARFISSGDIRLSDQDSAGIGIAGLFSAGALEFQSAQMYVASRLQTNNLPVLERAESDPGFLIQSASSITVTGNGGPTPVPLSFGERLTLRAPNIVQGGVLRAPQGQIRLEGMAPDESATGSVTLLPGSITSASLDGLTVPFGAVLQGGSFQGYDKPGEAPTKSVRLTAANVAVEKGAVVDVSGGGDLLGYQFVAGNGGSQDVLDASGGFAVLPSLGAGPAPLGGVATLQDPRLKVGDTVWLQGVPGLANGYYTLLPAHYALLPDGLLVQPMGGSYASAPETFASPDRAVVASGYRTVSGTPIRDQAWGRFLVMPARVFNQYSDLVTYSFNDYAQGVAQEAGLVARTPNDAGAVVLNASQSLLLQGTGRFDAGKDGLLGNLDISAPKIAVGAAPDSGFLALDPQALTDFGAGSVLLGGTRTATAAGTAVNVNATDVVVDTGAASAWTGPEILLAATNSVSIKDGSIIRAQGAASRDTNPLLLTGDGALLRVSTGDRVTIVRTGATGAAGDLSIGSAGLLADGSLTLDGARSISLSPSAVLSGRQFDLSSVRVNLGDAPAGEPGTTLAADTIARLASAADLLIRGHDSIQIYGDLNLGGRDASGAATVQKITLDTGLLQGHSDEGERAQITAGELTLRNSGGASTNQAASGTGSLALDVDTLTLGPGQVQFAGYGAMQGRAGAIEVQGNGSLDFGGNVSLATGQLRAGSGASYTLSIGGDIALTRDASAGALPEVKSLGGSLALEASSVLLDTSVALPAGTFQATAHSGALQVGPNATIDVRGTAVDFEDQVRFAPGGTIRLAAAGDVAVAAGSALDVSGSSRGGDSGAIELTAGGTASVAGDLRGAAGEGYRGGSFALDAAAVGTTGDFSALNAKLENGGFDMSRTVRLRNQDIVLGSGESIHAHEVVLRSDAGQVTVAGTIAAAGDAVQPDGGRIQLIGGNGVVIEGTLDAHAGAPPPGGFDPASGKVEIVATGRSVDVTSVAVIDVTGGRSGGGSVVVRAPRSGNDIAVKELAGDFRGARELVIQGVQNYQPDVAADGTYVVDGSLVTSMLGDASTWLQNSGSAIEARFPGWQIAPGMVVTSGGDLSIESDIPLNGTLGPGYLGFVAAGSINVGAAVSDGFASTARDAALLSGRSFSYGFESGGDITLQPNAIIRTGTGDIAIQTGQDLKLIAPQSPSDKPPVIYTAGLETPVASGFLGAPIGEFPTEGGDIDIRAGRDILAPFPAQTTSAWLFRYGDTSWGGDAPSSTVAQQTSWSVVYKNFEQGVGALGGGDVRVEAGRDIVQLQISIPTTGHLTTQVGQVTQEGDLVVRGGGDLELTAGRDVLGGLFMLGRGHADLLAGGRVVASSQLVGLRSTASGQGFGPDTVGALFGLMDATATVRAGSTVEIEGAFDPMMQGQIAENLVSGNGSAFSGYTDRTALEVTSVSGSVTYRSDPWASADLASPFNMSNPTYQVSMQGSGVNSKFGLAPGTLRFTSLDSSVFLKDNFAGAGTLTMASAGRGTLEALAKQDVSILLGIQMQDIAPEYRRGPLDPFSTTGDRANLGTIKNDETTNWQRGFTPFHTDDPEPVRLYALDGSVCADLSGSCAPGGILRPALIQLPKPIDVYAGKDVFEGNYQPQNDGPDALSQIRAGRDVHDVALGVTGEGAALVEAGRNVVTDLPNAKGVTSVNGGLVYSEGDNSKPGAIPNTALPHGKAADVYVIAGTAGGVDWDGFAAAYLDPANGQHVVRTYLAELREYMTKLSGTDSTISDADLVAAFKALPLARREIFLDRVYFTELKETGVDYNDPNSPRFHSYDRGFQAVSLLFPTDPSTLTEAQRGNVILNAKPVETWADGDVTILAPYGRVAVGTELADTSGQGGIVTRRGGDIRIMSDENIDLFTSRVFTLQGGDITMWTSDGSITAGSGAKTSVFNVPLSYTMSNDGVVTVNAFGLQTGAGIGVLDALGDAQDRPRSRLDLIAPKGEVNAGDAGIRVVGDLNIAAQVVVGIENIQVSGATAGVSKVEVPSIGALTSASQLAQAVSKEGVGPAAQPKTAVEDLPSIITVEVVGYETTDQVEGPGDGSRQHRKRREPNSSGAAQSKGAN